MPPLLPNLRIRGLNIFTVYTECYNGYSSSSIPNPLLIRVCNKTKGLKWIYTPSCHGVPDNEKQVMWLSHWKLGSGLEGGDEVTVSVFTKPLFLVKECGIQLVHEQEDEMSTQHNTIVPSYASAISRDLSEFIPGTYYLGGGPFLRLTREDVLGWKKEVWFNDISGDSDEETGMVFSQSLSSYGRDAIHTTSLSSCTLSVRNAFKKNDKILILECKMIMWEWEYIATALLC